MEALYWVKRLLHDFKMLGKWNSLKYQDSPFTPIYVEVSAVYDSH